MKYLNDEELFSLIGQIDEEGEAKCPKSTELLLKRKIKNRKLLKRNYTLKVAISMVACLAVVFTSAYLPKSFEKKFESKSNFLEKNSFVSKEEYIKKLDKIGKFKNFRFEV